MASSRASQAASGRSKAAWAARTETRNLGMPPALLKQAQANTRAAAQDVVFLARLAEELATTRGPELTLAYRNLVWVLPGFRKRVRGGKVRVTKEVCLVCVVRNKGRLRAGDRQVLPACLTVYAERDGERKLFAIATDVQDVGEYHGAAAHSDSGVWVKNGAWPDAPGSFACLVKVSTGTPPGQLCVISAQHVLTPFPDGVSLQVAGGLPLLPLDARGYLADRPQLGVTLPFGGLLRSDEREDRPSLDVQLAEVDAAVAQLAGPRQFDPAQPWVKSFAELLLLARQASFYLLPPDNHRRAPGRGPIRLQLTGMPARPVAIPYVFAGSPRAETREVFQTELLRFDVPAGGKAVPLRGDSGSAIVAPRASGKVTLVAMHVAGNENGLSWAVPAWQLFDTRYWRQFPTGARIEPMDA